MSLAALFNHRVLPYRQAAVEEDDFGDVTAGGWMPTFTPPVTGLNARPEQAWSGALDDSGPGEQQAGRRRWFLAPDLDVQERDVLDVVSGPEAPAKLRVVSLVPTMARVRLHHLAVTVEPFSGELV